MNIFVSYTTRDNYIEKEYLLKIEAILLSYGRVYVDLLHNDSFKKQQRVHDELIASDVLVLIRSESITESEWVNWEIRTAKANLIPIIIIGSNFSKYEIDQKFRGKKKSVCC